MYIHLGEEVVIRTKELIAILDRELAEHSDSFTEFLNTGGRNVNNLSKGPYKSIVITDTAVYLSPIASATLKRRSEKCNYEPTT